MDSRYKVLHVSRFDFQDEGKTIKGCKVTALGPQMNEDNSKGCQVLVLSAPYEIWNRFSQLPADYELDLVPKVVQGKVVLSLRDAAPAAK